MIKIEDLKDVKNLDEIEGLVIHTYCPIQKKENIIRAIINAVVIPDENDMLHEDVVVKEISFVSMVILLYTNIEITSDDYLNYDIAKKNRLYERIIEHVGVYEVDALCSLYNAMINNKLKDNSIEYTMAKRTGEIMNMLDGMFEHLNSMLDKGDPNVISKHFTDMISKLLKKMPDLSNFDVMLALEKLKK